MKTYTLKASEHQAKWWLIDAENLVLGRLASEVSRLVRGKHKPTYTPHMDCGDHVVIINAERVALTGRKGARKIYYRHTGHPGGIKEASADEIREGKRPERLLKLAIKRMIPRGPLGRQQLKHVHIYSGSEHQHDAQKPTTLPFADRNSKNMVVNHSNIEG